QPQPRKTRRIRTSQQNQPQSDHHQQRQQPNQLYQINPDYQIYRTEIQFGCHLGTASSSP
ncbi:hypothetical protein, partial [Cutibacterium avidum]|uniref:hypothetical protein n=1 Tax=Cutibacterium avidum TaxID=33010 RepID=UPI002FEEB6A2